MQRMDRESLTIARKCDSAAEAAIHFCDIIYQQRAYAGKGNSCAVSLDLPLRPLLIAVNVLVKATREGEQEPIGLERPNTVCYLIEEDIAADQKGEATQW